MRIALAQINSTVGDLNGNIEKISDYVVQAKKIDADIVVFPELAITGYPPEDLLFKNYFIKDNVKALRELALKVKDTTTIVGFVDQDKRGLIYNAAAVIDQGKIKGIYQKNHLPNYGVFDEQRYFTQGIDFKIFQHNNIPFSVNICEDIWLGAQPCLRQAQAGSQILINLSASPYHYRKTHQRESILSECAKRSHAFVCYCNLVGGQDELVFDGSSVVFSPQGKVIARGKSFEEDLVAVDILEGLSKGLKQRGRRFIKVGKSPFNQEKKEIQKEKQKKLSSQEEIYKALVLGTKDYVKKNRFSKVVIGISGGIDSALVAAIACDAVGKENVVGVSMPSRFSSQETKSDARLLAKNLDIVLHEISIKEIFDAYLKTLNLTFKGKKADVTEENLQARIRGNLLMALSNKFGYLVLATGNKSEIAVGYCTLYGDMAGGFAVLKDVPKTTVYDLAFFVNKNKGKTMIPQSILTRAPTAELKKDQKDQDTLPPYPVLDAILEAYIEKEQGLKNLIKKKDQGLVRRIVHLVDAMEYKRRQSPPGVKLTPKAFGKDRRLPITNYYREQ